MGGRHHLRPHAPRLALCRSADRFVFTARIVVGHGCAADHHAYVDRLGDGPSAPAGLGRAPASCRLRASVWGDALSTTAGSPGHPMFDESSWQLLGQRGDRELLRHAQNRIVPWRPALDAGASTNGNLCGSPMRSLDAEVCLVLFSSFDFSGLTNKQDKPNKPNKRGRQTLCKDSNLF